MIAKDGVLAIIHLTPLGLCQASGENCSKIIRHPFRCDICSIRISKIIAIVVYCKTFLFASEYHVPIKNLDFL